MNLGFSKDLKFWSTLPKEIKQKNLNPNFMIEKITNV
jgi:hypothetical protein